MTRITQCLSREHEIVMDRLDRFQRAIEVFDAVEVGATLRFFDESVLLHRRKEEEILFPALAVHLGDRQGPVACMLHDHQQERRALEMIREALAEGAEGDARKRIVAAGRYILDLLRAHIQKEDGILFPLAERMLNDEEKERVKAGMEKIGCFGGEEA